LYKIFQISTPFPGTIFWVCAVIQSPVLLSRHLLLVGAAVDRRNEDICPMHYPHPPTNNGRRENRR